MRRAAALFVGLLVSACLPQPPKQMEPVALHSPRPAVAVIQELSKQLVMQGFDMSVADATGGILGAKRTKPKRGNYDYIVCSHKQGSILENELISTVSVSIAASNGADGSDVRIRTNVLASYPGTHGIMHMPDSETDCASNGALEKQLADAIRAP